MFEKIAEREIQNSSVHWSTSQLAAAASGRTRVKPRCRSFMQFTTCARGPNRYCTL